MTRVQAIGIGIAYVYGSSYLSAGNMYQPVNVCQQSGTTGCNTTAAIATISIVPDAVSGAQILWRRLRNRVVSSAWPRCRVHHSRESASGSDH